MFRLSRSATSFLSAGVRIRFTDEGEGDAVILVHGITRNLKDWKRVRKLLSERFRVIAIDCRGHGKSAKPHDTASYGIEMVNDIVRLMDHLGIERAHVVGYSMGAEISLKLATQHADRLLRLHVGGSGWGGERDVKVYSILADSLASGGIGLFVEAVESGEHPELAGYLPELSWLERQIFELVIRMQDTRALAAVARRMGDIVNISRDELVALNMPVYGIAGEDDPERPNLERMVGVVPDYTMHVIDGIDHLAALESAEYRNSIVEFLGAER